jgi:hypothetical protein
LRVLGADRVCGAESFGKIERFFLVFEEISSFKESARRATLFWTVLEADISNEKVFVGTIVKK